MVLLLIKKICKRLSFKFKCCCHSECQLDKETLPKNSS